MFGAAKSSEKSLNILRDIFIPKDKQYEFYTIYSQGLKTKVYTTTPIVMPTKNFNCKCCGAPNQVFCCYYCKHVPDLEEK